MSEEILEKFNEAQDKFVSNSITLDEAVNLIKILDFNLLSIEEIKVVEDADWIPDDLYVQIIRGWMKNQENNINQIISYLTMTSSIGKDQMISFVNSIFKPQNSLSLMIDNIIEKIGTGGGSRNYENPVELELIKATSPDEMNVPIMKLANLFSGDPKKKFQSMAKPKASFRIDFPPYLKVIPSSYKIRTPISNKGPKSWVLQAKNEHETWIDLATETNSIALNSKGSEGTFPITQKSDTAYSSFQFINLDITYDNNHSLALSGFDISGIVFLKSNRKFKTIFP